MKLTPIKLYGINSDAPNSDLPLDIYTGGFNIRFDDGFVKKSKGWVSAYTPTVAPLHIMNIVALTSSYWIYCGTNKIYADDGSGAVDLTTAYMITPAVSVDGRWTSTQFNGLPILNPKTSDPVYWDLNIANDVVALPGWVTNDKADVIRSYKNYLIAINVTEGGVKNNNLIKWSSRASAGALPDSWTALPTNAAGIKEFSATDDILIDGVKLKDYFVIYKQKSCYLMVEIGGQYVFKFTDLFNEFGALAEGCVVEFEKKHAVLTIDDFIVHDGNTWQSKIDGIMRDALFNTINEEYIEDTYLIHHKSQNEILICFTDTNSTIPNKALTWNYREDTWGTFRDIPESYSMVNGVYAGVIPNETWDADNEIWNDDNTTWDEASYSTVGNTLIAASYSDIALYEFTKTTYDANGAYYNSFVERTSMPLGNDDRVKLVRELWPDIRAVDGTIFDMSIGLQQRPNDAISWKSYTFTVGTDEKVDIYEKGRFISLKISDTETFTWKMSSKLQFDLGDAGKYNV